MGSGRTLALLGAALAALVAGALFLVLDDDGGTAPGDGDPVLPGGGGGGDAPKDGPGAAKGDRKRSKVAGTGSLFGVVKRRQGSVPAAGQTVVVKRDGADAWTADADEQGNFRVDDLGEGGPYEILVEAKGFATIRLPGIALNRGEKRDVGTLWLDAAARAVVNVRTQTAEPVVGAKVSAYAAPNYDDGYDWTKAVAQMAAEPVAVATATTDARGAAVFPELASGSWTFVASKPGLSREGRANVDLPGGESVEDIEILLRTAYELKGRVLSESGAPVANAVVVAARMSAIWDVGNGALRIRSKADGEGKFRIDSLSAGTWSLLTCTPGGFPALAATVKVPAVKEIDLRLATGGKLSGKVTNADTGAPVEGAVVRAVSWSGSAQIVETTTDATGAYVFDPLPAPTINDVTVEKPGLVVEREGQRWQISMVPSGDAAERNFKMRTGGSVDGIVMGPDKTPVAGARVQLWIGRVNEGGESGGVTTTDAGGRFHFEGVGKGIAIAIAQCDGLYQRELPADGWWSALQSPTPQTYRADAGPGIAANVEINMARGVRVAGKVEGPDGPFDGATVFVGGKRVRSGKDGTFAAEGVAPTPTLQVGASANGFVLAENKTIAVIEGQPVEDVALRLQRQAVVRGKVYAAPGLTLADARVTLEPQGGAPDEMMMPMMMGGDEDAGEWHAVRSDGSFSIPVPSAEGKWAVRAAADGHAPTTSKPFDVSPAQLEYEASVTLVVGDTISGRATSGGAGVAGARISVTQGFDGMDMGMMWDTGDSGGATPIVAIADGNGLFSVSNLRAGKYTVEASFPGLVKASKSGVKPGGTAVELALSPELEIAGKVLFDDGSPCTGVMIQAVREGGAGNPGMDAPGGGAPTGSDGRFVVRGLADGRYRLRVAAPWGSGVNVRSTTSDPIAAGSRDVTVKAQRGLTISGRILDAQKQPASNCWVNAEPEGDVPHEWIGTQSKEDGTFEIAGLGEGTFTINVQRPEMNGSSSRPLRRTKVAAGTKDLEIQLEEGLAIEGVLVDAAGKPLAQVHLAANPIRDEAKEGDDDITWGQGAQTAADGKFRIGGLTPGRYSMQMQVWDASNAAASKVLTGGESVAAGTSGLRLVAVEGQKIAGICVDEAGAGIAGVQIQAHLANNAGWRQVTSGAEGRFEVLGVPEGKHTLSFSGAERSSRQIDDVAAGTQNLRVELERGLKLAGKITGADGKPLAGSQVHLSRTDDKAHGWAMTDDEGNFATEGLAPGDYKVRILVPKPNEANSFEEKEIGTAKAGDEAVSLSVR